MRPTGRTRLRFEMCDLGVGGEPDPPTFGPHPEAEVDVFVTVAVFGVETFELFEEVTADREAGAGDGGNFSGWPGGHDVAGGEDPGFDPEGYPGMLDLTIGIEQGRAGDTDGRVVEGGDESFEPTGLRDGVVVEEDEDVGCRLAGTLIAMFGESPTLINDDQVGVESGISDCPYAFVQAVIAPKGRDNDRNGSWMRSDRCCICAHTDPNSSSLMAPYSRQWEPSLYGISVAS